jgi:hypothetical protein
MPDLASEAFQREPRLAGRHGRVRGEPREGESDCGNPQQGKGEQAHRIPCPGRGLNFKIY